ncbi:hypothetical protein BSZ07_00880 [Streptomyces sp. M1013]|uniref:hypothetical protein n=1 Tax=Streptomyces sp. M1013 TaxID=549798 RepID=UPI000978F9FA|nr:hypothetical protein [Streptomyces sp. M1013]OMI91461.1 hypothetical protein BSZ07_00880 [Streptomyces sp. M1013]
MSTPGRRMPCSNPTRCPPPARRPTRAVQWAGRVLCWSLAAGMATAAADLLLSPQGIRWHALWLLPWYLTGAAAITWACLRAREKAAHRQVSEEDDDSHGEWDQAA